jgi:uncharacterized protein YbbC (DUF1343 family)
VRFVPTRFTPKASTHAGKECGGVQIYVADWADFESLPAGLALACALRKLHPKEWQVKRYGALLGHPPTLEAVARGEPPGRVGRLWEAGLARFREVRGRYLLYGPAGE